jgi:hypothetical protein
MSPIKQGNKTSLVGQPADWKNLPHPYDAAATVTRKQLPRTHLLGSTKKLVSHTARGQTQPIPLVYDTEEDAERDDTFIDDISTSTAPKIMHRKTPSKGRHSGKGTGIGVERRVSQIRF